MNVPSRNLDKANFSTKKKGKQCAAFGCLNTLDGPNGLPTSFHFFKLMHLLYSLWIMNESNYCCKLIQIFY